MSEAEIKQALRGQVRRLNVRAQGIVIGLLAGAGIFLATAALLLRGGDPVGPHLSLLGYYFPGYEVTWPGAFIGLAYGFVCGFIVGAATSAIYNALLRGRGR